MELGIDSIYFNLFDLIIPTDYSNTNFRGREVFFKIESTNLKVITLKVTTKLEK